MEALEDFQEQVQGDIASLQDIISKLNSSVTVNNVVDNGDGSWTINFSDGTSVTIRNGQDGEDGLTPPSITVVEEDGTYYWAYEDENGNTEFILDDDGNKIPVTGEAPQVRINPDSGNWEISSDGGKTWEDTGVKAEGGDGDSFFSDVYVEGGILYLVLADGTVIEVPMTAELAFDFGTDESVLYFAAGESKTLEYTMSGAETYTITKPDGWRASIEGEGLVITAPAAENVYAETEGVVSVILFAANGQSFLAEMPVVLGEDPDAVKVVEFPDPVLKAYLVERYDSNGDGEIDTEEAAAVDYINCSAMAHWSEDQKVHDVSGLEYCKNLEYLRMEYGLFNSIDLTPFEKITTVNIKINKNLTDVKVAGNKSITSLNITNTGISDLDMTGCVSLDTLVCGSLGIDSFDFVKGSEHLKYISSDFNNLTSLDMSSFPELEQLSISYNNTPITHVDFSANTNFRRLDIINSKVPTSIDFSACTNLYWVSLQYANVTEVIFPENNPDLATVVISSGTMETLDLGYAPNLGTLKVPGHRIKSLDISGLTSLKEFEAHANGMEELITDGCDNLTTVNISSNNFSDISFLYKHETLNSLMAGGNKITEIDPAQLVNVHHLDMSGNLLSGDLDVSMMPQASLTVNVYDNVDLKTVIISGLQAFNMSNYLAQVRIMYNGQTQLVIKEE